MFAGAKQVGLVSSRAMSRPVQRAANFSHEWPGRGCKGRPFNIRPSTNRGKS